MGAARQYPLEDRGDVHSAEWAIAQIKSQGYFPPSIANSHSDPELVRAVILRGEVSLTRDRFESQARSWRRTRNYVLGITGIALPALLVVATAACLLAAGALVALSTFSTFMHHHTSCRHKKFKNWAAEINTRVGQLKFQAKGRNAGREDSNPGNENNGGGFRRDDFDGGPRVPRPGGRPKGPAPLAAAAVPARTAEPVIARIGGQRILVRPSI